MRVYINNKITNSCSFIYNTDPNKSGKGPKQVSSENLKCLCVFVCVAVYEKVDKTVKALTSTKKSLFRRHPFFILSFVMHSNKLLIINKY